ncbi:MAG: hypothetical protein ACK55Z_20420, partial [bacterium]
MSVSTAHSQIVVKEATKDSTVWYSKLTGLPKLTHFYDAESNWYTLYYKNLDYQYITDIDYINLDSKENTIEFFNILKQALIDKKELTLELDGKTWFLKTGSNMAIMSSSGTSFYLTNKNLDKILEALQ